MAYTDDPCRIKLKGVENDRKDNVIILSHVLFPASFLHTFACLRGGHYNKICRLAFVLVFEGPVSRLEKDRDWTGLRLEKTRTGKDQDRKRPQRDRFKLVDLYPQ